MVLRDIMVSGVNGVDFNMVRCKNLQMFFLQDNTVCRGHKRQNTSLASMLQLHDGVALHPYCQVLPEVAQRLFKRIPMSTTVCDVCLVFIICA